MLPKIRQRIFLAKTLNVVYFDDQILFTYVLAMPIIIKIHNSEGTIQILFENTSKFFKNTLLAKTSKQNLEPCLLIRLQLAGAAGYLGQLIEETPWYSNQKSFERNSRFESQQRSQRIVYKDESTNKSIFKNLIQLVSNFPKMSSLHHIFTREISQVEIASTCDEDEPTASSLEQVTSHKYCPSLFLLS